MRNLLKKITTKTFHREAAKSAKIVKSLMKTVILFWVSGLGLNQKKDFLRGLCGFAVIMMGYAAPAFASAEIYPCNGGDLRRENHALSPSGISNPLQVKWTAPACTTLTVPAGGPVVLADRVIQAFVHGVRCVDRATGNPIWTWSCPDVELYYTPTYDADRNVIYLSRMDGSLVCLSVTTGQVLWYFYEDNALDVGCFASPIYVNNRIYCADGGKGFCCLDPDTHQVVWRFNFAAYLGRPFRDGVGTPAYDNGSIYFSCRNGDMFCLRETDGSCQWHIHENCWRQNALLLSDNYVFSMANQGTLSCRNRSDGSLVWSTGMTGTTDGNLAICGNLLIVPGDSWRIWGVDMATGKSVWCTTLMGNFARNTPFVSCGKVYISACHGDYVGLDGQTGKIEWQYHHGVEYTFVDWAEADSNLFVACRDGRIFCFEPVTPGNPADCVCNLSATLPPTATPTATFTPTVTPTVPAGATPGCSGSLCLASDTVHNSVFFDQNNAAPPSDGSGRSWNNPDYVPAGSWSAAQAVTQPPAEWTAPCGTGTNQTWIAPFASGLPPTLADSYFRNGFTLPGGVTVTSVNLTLSADNSVEVWLNGHDLGLITGPLSPDSHLYARCAPVTVDPSFFRAGTNVLAFRVINTLTFNGLTYECCLSFGCSGPPLTDTPTITATPTITPTFTATPTGTWYTSTPTNSPTLTPSPTATVSATMTPETVCHPVAYPNPSHGDPIHFNCGGGPYDDIRVKVFTTSFRQICHTDHTCHGLIQENVQWDLKDDYGAPVANGLYFVEIETHTGDKVKKYYSKCLVLK